MARGGSLRWSADAHHRWPRAFKTAARTLLLAARRAATGCLGHDSSTSKVRAATAVGAAGGLMALPPDLLLHIVHLAAAPMAAWL